MAMRLRSAGIGRQHVGGQVVGKKLLANESGELQQGGGGDDGLFGDLDASYA
jgi:hypothetical protein